MKKMMPRILKLAVLSALALGALSISSPTPAEAVAACPRNIQCLDVWDPVICSNGQIYSNACYAHRACATGCVPYGDTI